MAIGGSQQFPLRVPADNADLAPEPKYPWLDKASKGLQTAHQFMSAPFGYENPPGEMVSNALGVPDVSKMLGNIAYDAPLTTEGGPLHKLMNMRPEVGGSAMAVAPLVGPAMKYGAKAGKAIAPTVAEMAVELSSKYGVDPRMNIIKPKGGNWIAGTPENTTNKLKKAIPARMPMAEVNIEGVNIDQAVNNFIDKKLNKYIKNEMGTEIDPIRLGIERRAAEAEKLKEANQARLAKMEADIARAKAAGKDTTLSEGDLERAREKFADEEYIASEGLFHGTAPQEGWAAHPIGTEGFEKGLQGKRQIAGVQSEPLGTHPASKKWERSVDAEMRVAHAKHELRQPDAVENNPWLAKVDPNSNVYAVDAYADTSFEFRHMIDELKEAMNPASVLPNHLKIAPKDLEKMTVDDVSALSGKISAWRNRQKTKTDLEIANNPATHTFKEYPLDESNPKGVSWRQIKLPEGLPKDEAEEAVRAATKYEGDIMRHCVGGAGHCEPLLRGDVELYTLRDAKGEPHVTIEVQPGSWNWLTIREHGGDPLQITNMAKRFAGITPENEDQIMRSLDSVGRLKKQEEVSNLVNKIYEQKIGAKAPASILEIKGKNNRKPNPEYIPFVQDFVKSGNFSHIINDIHHTDLRTSKDVLGAGVLAELQRRGEKVPPFLDFEDAAHFQELFKPGSLDMLGGKEGYRKQWQAGIQNHAKGGIVRKAIGGITQGNNMQTPTLAQMRVQLNQRRNPDYMNSIGVEQAIDMTPKSYISPNPRSNDFMPVGGVSDQEGLPVGGIDQDNRQLGQQFMPADVHPQPNQDGQPNSAPEGADGEQPGGYESNAPQGPNPPMGNLLSMTPQGQKMQAMGPVNGQPQGLAEGGQPEKRKTFAIQPATQKARKEPEFTPYDPKKINKDNLAKAFDESIAHHLSLSHSDRIANSAKAAKAVGKFIGHTGDGKVKDLLGKNAKLLKTETGKDEEPIKLPDNRGVETTGLALAPAYEEAGFNTCPNSASCKAECLGKTSGNYFKLGGGQDLSEFKGPRLNSLLKTQAFLHDPHSFAIKLHDEIQAAKDMAGANGNHLGVRLNVLSDINPRVHKSIINAHPDVTFYDYTKNNTNPVAPNHHYTYSSTGVSQEGVDNPNTNWKQMRKRLLEGDNVAMAFTHKSHLPEHVHDEETGQKFKVINGDSHDFRPLDMQPEGEHGVIIGLKNKKATGEVDKSHIDSHGFFVHYDPKEKMTTNAKGKPVYERKLGHGLTPKGKPRTVTIATNKEVSIKPQNKDLKLETNDGA